MNAVLAVRIKNLRREVQEPSTPQTLDVTGLTARQVEHIRNIADDLREANS